MKFLKTSTPQKIYIHSTVLNGLIVLSGVVVVMFKQFNM